MFGWITNEVLYPYGGAIAVSPESLITTDLQIQKAFPAVEFLGSESSALYQETREVSGDWWFASNATFEGVSTPNEWAQVVPAQASYATVLRGNGSMQRLIAPAGAAAPLAWVTLWTVDALGGQFNTPSIFTTNAEFGSSIALTWNAPGVAMTAQKINVVDTASTAGSLLQDLEVGGVSKWSVRKDGTLTVGIVPSATISGILPLANGGTGAASLAAANIAVINANNNFSASQTAAGLTSTAGVAVGGALTGATTGAFSSTVGITGRLTLSAGITVGGTLTTATTGSFTGAVTAASFSGSGAGLTAGTVPNAALVTAPVTSVTASGNMSSSGGTTPNITIAAAPTFAGTLTAVNLQANAGSIVDYGSIVGATNAALGSISTPTTGFVAGALLTQTTTSTGEVEFGGALTTGQISFNPSGFSQAFVFSVFGVAFANINGGVYTNSSDRRFKKNIQPISYGLKEILRLKPSSFAWTTDGKNDLGFIAQDMKRVLPELVHTGPGPKKHLGINYAGITPVVVKSIQQIDARLVKLEKLFKQLK